MDYTKVVCFDLEMCCWNDGRNPRTGEIIEIGIAEVDLFTGVITRVSQYYVKPEKDEVSAFCTELTGITQAVVDKQGRPLKEVIESIEKRYGFNKIYGAWGRDQWVVLDECQRKGIRIRRFEYVNYSLMYKMSKKTKKMRFGHRKAMNMENLGWQGQQHSGVVDAFNLARLVLHMNGFDGNKPKIEDFI